MCSELLSQINLFEKKLKSQPKVKIIKRKLRKEADKSAEHSLDFKKYSMSPAQIRTHNIQEVCKPRAQSPTKSYIRRSDSKAEQDSLPNKWKKGSLAS